MTLAWDYVDLTPSRVIEGCAGVYLLHRSLVEQIHPCTALNARALMTLSSCWLGYVALLQFLTPVKMVVTVDPFHHS